MLELVLARHGQSYGNLDRSLGPDTDLTDLGCEQATQLGRWLAEQGYAFTACYCSTLRRARQTAAIINARFGLEIIFDPDLRETEHPYLDNLPARADPLDVDPPPPFCPEYEAFRVRVMRAISRILTAHSTGQVIVVAHAGTLATMLRGMLHTHALLIRTEQAAVHCLRWENGRWNLQYVNRQEHLAISTDDTPADPTGP
jgi:broad specificity phosphatase PhoE